MMKISDPPEPKLHKFMPFGSMNMIIMDNLN